MLAWKWELSLINSFVFLGYKIVHRDQIDAKHINCWHIEDGLEYSAKEEESFHILWLITSKMILCISRQKCSNSAKNHKNASNYDAFNFKLSSWRFEVFQVTGSGDTSDALHLEDKITRWNNQKVMKQYEKRFKKTLIVISIPPHKWLSYDTKRISNANDFCWGIDPTFPYYHQQCK